jgi:AcrR family transcriptional regulator
VLTSSQGAIEQVPSGSGLRSLKKHKTRLAIQDVALELFAEQGFESTTVEQIADRADVSVATFFRYFKTKADVVFGADGDERSQWLPALERAIVGRPSSEDDLTAVQQAVLQEWVPRLEPTRLRRQFMAAETSPLLHGLSSDLAVKWQATIRDAIAKRQGLTTPDLRCRLAAAMALATFSETVNVWINEGCGDLATAIEQGFEHMTQLCREWHDAAARRR